MVDYSLWEVIENVNAHPITQVVEGVETTIAPAIAEEKAQKRECRSPRSQDTKYKENTKKIVPMETHASSSLVSCDGLGGYDWSDQAKKEFVNESIVTKPTVEKPAVETSEAKASADKPKVVKKNFGPPLIED
nr:hypothetical protein [Tanacetum cinerariifolium]